MRFATYRVNLAQAELIINRFLIMLKLGHMSCMCSTSSPACAGISYKKSRRVMSYVMMLRKQHVIR